MGHWTPTGVEPKDYDDDDDFRKRTLLPCGMRIVFFAINEDNEMNISEAYKDATILNRMSA